jgi:hypothetical protein
MAQAGPACITRLFFAPSGRFALQAGVALNLDNFQELERTAALIAADHRLLQQQDPSAQSRLIGLRVNPQVSVSAWMIRSRCVPAQRLLVCVSWNMHINCLQNPAKCGCMRCRLTYLWLRWGRRLGRGPLQPFQLAEQCPSLASHCRCVCLSTSLILQAADRKQHKQPCAGAARALSEQCSNSGAQAAAVSHCSCLKPQQALLTQPLRRHGASEQSGYRSVWMFTWTSC